MTDKRVKEISVGVLLIVAASLTAYGAFMPNVVWYTGSKITILLAMVAMYSRWLMFDGNKIAPYIEEICTVLGLVLGIHLLAPYFWPARTYAPNQLVVFAVTVALAWGILWWELKQFSQWKENEKLWGYLPWVIMCGNVMALKWDTGVLWASGLLSLWYLLYGSGLLLKALLSKDLIRFNCGLLLLLCVGLSLFLTFTFALPSTYIVIGSTGLVLLANLMFLKWKKGVRK